MSATPYAFERWPRIHPEDVARLRRVARALPNVRLEEIAATLGELTNAHLTVTPGPLYTCSPGTLAQAVAEPLVAVVLRPPTLEAPLVVELSPDLAIALVDRLLGGDGAQVAEPIGGLTEVECGVVAYAAARGLACTTRPWKIAGVLTTRLALLGVVGDEGCAAWVADVRMEAEGSPVRTGLVRAWIPDATSWVEPAPEGGRFGALPLTMTVDLGEATLAASELVGLGLADVLVPDETWWAREKQLRLRVLGASATTFWARAEDEGLVLRAVETNRAGAATTGRKIEMSETDVTATLKALGDAPVEVSIEVARLRTTLAELQAMRVGEVVTTGTLVGASVRLRVGDVVVGEGELVEVDGMVGVKITALDAD